MSETSIFPPHSCWETEETISEGENRQRTRLASHFQVCNWILHARTRPPYLSTTTAPPSAIFGYTADEMLTAASNVRPVNGRRALLGLFSFKSIPLYQDLILYLAGPEYMFHCYISMCGDELET